MRAQSLSFSILSPTLSNLTSQRMIVYDWKFHDLYHPYQIFEAAPQESRGVPSRNPAPDYFL